MSILLTLLSILLIIIIFSLPLLLAQKWIKNQEYIRTKYKPKQKKKIYIKKTQVKHDFMPLFESIISMQSKIAKSDGSISVAEATYIKNTITNFISIAKQNGLKDSKLFKLREHLLNTHKKAKNARIPISSYAKKLKNSNMFIKEQVLRQLISIAAIDGYTQLKESLIFNAATTMGFNSLYIRRYIDNILNIKKEPSKDNSYYQVLGCKSTDSNATIKKSYRKFAKETHPDILHAKGLGKLEIELAKKKMQKINMAYEKIKKERKM